MEFIACILLPVAILMCGYAVSARLPAWLPPSRGVHSWLAGPSAPGAAARAGCASKSGA